MRPLAKVLAINRDNEIVPFPQNTEGPTAEVPLRKRVLSYLDFIEMCNWLGKKPTSDEWVEYNEALNNEPEPPGAA